MPTKEHVRAALDKVQRTADYDFFFENLKSAEWLEPLDELKQFDRPNEPLRDGDSLRYPFWPPARYLVKVAADKPDKVMQIILKVPPSENPRVHEDLVDAALKMPAEVSVKLFNKVIQWVVAPDANLLLLPNKVASYIAHIKAGGFKKEALLVADALLGLRKYEKQIDEGKDSLIKRADPIVRSNWEYGKALKELAPHYHKKDKVELVKLLAEKLRQAVLIEKSEDDREFRDLSYIWRGSIEDSSQNHKYGIKDTIANWMRDLSEEVLAEAPALVDSLCAYFCQQAFPIFSRFGIHLARLSGRTDLAAKFLLDQQLFDCLDVWHEFALLLESGYQLLSALDKKKLLAMIAADIAYRNKDKPPMNVNEEDNERSRYFYYYMIRQYLNGEAKAIFDRLHAKFGELEHPTFHSYTSAGWVGPTSPMQSGELKALPIAELKKFLNEWSPPADKWNFGPSVAGLGRELESVVSERIDEFSTQLAEFKVQEKTYVRSIIQGLSNALVEKKNFQWDSVVDYLLWASEQRDESADDAFKPGEDKDPSWSWTRQAACRFLEQGIASEAHEVPFTLREKAWGVISFGLSDVHPKVEEEDQYTSDNNYYQTAINSVRGVALEAAVHYGFWVKRNLGFSKEDLPIEKAPELFTALDRHLDLTVEKTKAVRSVYGRWTFLLLPLNRTWFHAKKDLILPAGEGLEGYWAAAWDANILFNHHYINIFAELRSHYLLAIDRIEISDDGKANKPEQRLVEHIIALFLYGSFELNSDILTKLYSKIDVKLKKRALKMIGCGLANEKHAPDTEIIKRSISFWNFRIEECKKLKEPKDRIELSEFGWWLKSGRLDDEWALDQTIEVLNLCRFITPDDMVMERLKELVDRYPIKVAEVLRLMVDHRVTDYGFYGWLEEAKILLLKLMATEAKDTAAKTIHKLGAYGFNQFGALLKGQISG